MSHRFKWRGMIFCSLAIGAAGCDTHRSFLRSKDQTDEVVQHRGQRDPAQPSAIESDPSKIMSVDSDEKDPKPFFKGGRRTGGWSSEARDIERNLGVN